MSFEIIHFRDSDKIIKEKNMETGENKIIGYIPQIAQYQHSTEAYIESIQEFERTTQKTRGLKC